MRTTKTLIYIIILSSLIFFSCEENIDWETQQSEIRLVVEGGITDELKYHQISLTYMRDIKDTASVKGVTEASVAVICTDSTYIFEESTTAPGVYISKNMFKGNQGSTYTLDINLKNEIGGYKNYKAIEKMTEPFRIDSISAIISENNPFSIEIGGDDDRNYLIIYTIGKEPDTLGNYYTFLFYKNNILITDTVSELGVVSDISVNGDSEFVFIIEGEFTENDTIAVECHSSTPQFYEFVYGIIQETDEPDVFGFGAPPANVYGNVNNGALGYFKASAITRGINKAIVE